MLQLAPGTPGIRQEILAMKQAINEADTYIPPVQVPSGPHCPATSASMHVERPGAKTEQRSSVQGGVVIEEIESDSDDEPQVHH